MMFSNGVGRFLVVVVVFLSCSLTLCANRTVTVTTQYGDVLGYETDTARIFYGIPFAQPPVNTLR